MPRQKPTVADSTRLVTTDPHLSLSNWANAVISGDGFVAARHQRLLINELEALSRGDTDRLMIQMPPGSAKSTYASVLLPPWWLARHPKDSIVATSHTSSLAAYFGRRAKHVAAEAADTLNYRLTGQNRASWHWSTSLGGEYYAVGTRGALIGRRADLAIIDDPVKSQAEADCRLQRDRVWEWYKADLIPRLKPLARIILVMTRWHQDDLCGRLLAASPQEWRCLKLPAAAEENDMLSRVPGEPLWPEWESDDALQRRRKSVGERAWLAQFQQSPRPDVGTLFPVSRLLYLEAPPPAGQGPTIRAWDLAATTEIDGGNPDWTVGLKLMRDPTGRHTVLDVVRLRGSFREVEDAIVATALIDGPNVMISLPQDPGQAGKSQVSYLTARLAGYRVTSFREDGSKAARATPVASQVEAGNLSLLRGNWNHTFVDELREFPYGHKDDQVDALSHAFNALVERGATARITSIPHMSR